MAPKVLVSDALSETAVQIFRDRGVEVDYLPDLGKDKEKLAEVIGQYDGLAIRSATKVTEKLLQNATNLKVIGRAGIGVDNVDIPAASKKGVPQDDSIWDHDNPEPRLRLITCDPTTPLEGGHYEGNWVVWAELA